MFTAALLMMAADTPCPAPQVELEISVTPIDGQAIGDEELPDGSGHYQVGDFVYQGNGIWESSSSPHYRELVLDQKFGLRHRCGNVVFGPSGWNADDPDLDEWTLQIEAGLVSREPSPGSLAAQRLGAVPTVNGYAAGATWPVGDFFLGLMHPLDGASKTLIVAFPSVPHEVPGHIVAEIPMKLETLAVVPNLHGPDNFVNLAALEEGRRTHLVLRLTRETVTAIRMQLAR